MVSDLWRWADPDGQQRKVRLDELRAALAGGLIAPNTPVWRSGWGTWKAAQEVPELTSASLGGANGVVLNIPPPPLAMVAVQQAYESLVPAAPSSAKDEEEPPPPPHYVPAAVKPSVAHLKTQVAGSAQVSASRAPPAPGGSAAVRAASSLGASLPTAIGLPPSPNVRPSVAPMTTSRPPAVPAGASRPPAVPAGASRPPVPPVAESVEELSGADLLDRSSHDLGQTAAPPTNGLFGPADGLPPPTDPVLRTAPPESNEAPPFVPRRQGLDLILDGIAEIRQGRLPKNKPLFAVLLVVGGSLLIGLLGGIVSLASGASRARGREAAATASVPTPIASIALATTAIAPAVQTPPPSREAIGPILGDCVATGEAKSIAPRAVITSGIEAQALGGALALGFAAGPREAVATLLEPGTLTATSTGRTRPTGGDVRRVSPLLLSGKVTALADVERKGDRLSGRRTVPTATLTDVGYGDGAILWAPHGKDSVARLFTASGDGPIDALRAIALPGRKGIAIAFRQGNMILVGAARGDGVLEPDGPLSKIAGLGQVGTPALAVSGDRIVVAWADRAGAQDDWQLRWARINVGSSTEDAAPFAIPDGGLGSQAMSPSVAALGGGRFLLVWTEGLVSNHQVRAITIDADGAQAGQPIAISAAGINAGQPSAVVGPDGRGAVAFLAAKGKVLEVQAMPISCPPR